MLNLSVPDPQPKDTSPASVPSTLQRGSGLLRYEAMVRAIAECHRVDEAKALHDQAQALAACAAVAKDIVAQRQLAEIRLRAAYRVGTLLTEMAESGARAGRGQPEETSVAPTLKSLGIKRDQAANWQKIAGLPWNDFIDWLAGQQRGEAVATLAGLLSLAKIRDAKARNAETLSGGGAAGGGTLADLERLAFERPNHFRVIYIDVPARFNTHSEAGLDRSAEMHYPTMTVEELCAMGPLIRLLAAKDCALLYWTSAPNFENAFRIVGAWSRDAARPDRPVFRYSTRALLWVKTLASLAERAPSPAELDFSDPAANPKIFARGNGYITAANAEDLLLFRKGAPLRLDTGVDELIFAPRDAHSAKPEEARRRIDLLYEGPKLELFARETAEGWTSWGNQVSEAGSQKSGGEAP